MKTFILDMKENTVTEVTEVPVEKKYVLTDEKLIVNDGKTTLYRIKAVKSFNYIAAGSLGGFIESESNLSHNGNCWVKSNACVYGNAVVRDNAKVTGNAVVRDNAKVTGNACVHDNVIVRDGAVVGGNANIFDDAIISVNAYVVGGIVVTHDAIINTWKFPQVIRSDGPTFIAVPDSKGITRVIAGCRYFTFDEAYHHWDNARRGSKLREETLLILDYLKKYVEIYKDDEK